uniref:Immunoglobulin superfamily member 10 n=1 Tax=Coturnix japonica TaxID=93934 RepID=A0A8C2U3G4_COTJA
MVLPNGTLAIAQAALQDGGQYRCTATNALGTAQLLATLAVVAYPPRIAGGTRLLTAHAGVPVTMRCPAEGRPPPSISWVLANETHISSSSQGNQKVLVWPDGTLMIKDVTVYDRGLYTFSITMKPAKIDHKQYFKKLVPYGKDFQVDCKASGSPAPEISWSLPDGTVINNVMQADDSGHRSRRYVLFDNGTLYLNRAGATEEGDYTCYAQNTLGRDEMKVHITVVTAAPQIKHSYKTYIKVKAGDTALMDCEAAGEPKPKIFWLLPSSDMISSSTDRHLLHANGSLSVHRAKLLDAGEYMCVARNAGGDDTKLYKLHVDAKPPIINAIPGKTTTLNCSVDGNPPPEVSWMLPNGTWISKGARMSEFLLGSNGTLTILNSSRDKAGKYRCAAKNQVGYIEKLIVLEVAQKPTILIHPKGPVRGISGESLSLHCLSDGNPKPSTAWTLPGGQVLDRPQINSRHILLENGTLVIRAATIHDRGHYDARTGSLPAVGCLVTKQRECAGCSAEHQMPSIHSMAAKHRQSLPHAAAEVSGGAAVQQCGAAVWGSRPLLPWPSATHRPQACGPLPAPRCSYVVLPPHPITPLPHTHTAALTGKLLLKLSNESSCLLLLLCLLKALPGELLWKGQVAEITA